jgi:DNA-binding PadR family transcriptional regulator
LSKLPRLTHLQFLVLGTLRSGALAGRLVRDQLEAFGVRTSGPAFYQVMARLEDTGLVEGAYHQEVVQGQIIRERHYRITGPGTTAWRESSDFYLDIMRAFGPERLAGA